MSMIKIVEGVEFNVIAREWRFKWSADNEKKSLEEAQKVLESSKAAIKSIHGLQEVKRVVCGGCLDFKVVIAVDASQFAAWEGKAFEPEASFLVAVSAIPGISSVETQTYTFMDVSL